MKFSLLKMIRHGAKQNLVNETKSDCSSDIPFNTYFHFHNDIHTDRGTFLDTIMISLVRWSSLEDVIKKYFSQIALYFQKQTKAPLGSSRQSQGKMWQLRSELRKVNWPLKKINRSILDFLCNSKLQFVEQTLNF